MPLYIDPDCPDDALLVCECRDEGLHLFRDQEVDDCVFVGPYFGIAFGFWGRLRTAWRYLREGWKTIDEVCLDGKSCDRLAEWLKGD